MLRNIAVTAMNANTHTSPRTTTPLETLIVRQLAEIKREEKLLTERYHALGTANKSAVEMNLFSDQLSKFDQRANRLFRLMRAMEGC